MSSANQDSDLNMDSILSSMAKMKADARHLLKANRGRILKALQAIQATRVVVSYSGSGDSGAIDHIDIYRGEEKLDPKRRVFVLRRESRWNPDRPGWDESLTKKLMPITEALQELVYDWLGAEHGGWENNDGASGECIIDVVEGQFILGHTNYYTESDYTESAL